MCNTFITLSLRKNFETPLAISLELSIGFFFLAILKLYVNIVMRNINAKNVMEYYSKLI